MSKIVIFVITSFLLAASTAFAAEGVSTSTPGHEAKTHARGSVGGPGASGYAPGRKYVKHHHKAVRGHPGASGYAPGQER